MVKSFQKALQEVDIKGIEMNAYMLLQKMCILPSQITEWESKNQRHKDRQTDTYTHTVSAKHTHTHTVSKTHTHTHTVRKTHTHTVSNTQTQTHKHTRTHTHTHTHTHSQ